jgi:hypothetical protein
MRKARPTTTAASNRFPSVEISNQRLILHCKGFLLLDGSRFQFLESTMSVIFKNRFLEKTGGMPSYLPLAPTRP